MIINANTLEELYYATPLQDILVDTWFLHEQDVCCFNIPFIQTTSVSDTGLKFLLSEVVKNANHYQTFGIDELSIVFTKENKSFNTKVGITKNRCLR